MGFNLYPYTNFHELNIDWLLNIVKQIPGALEKMESELGDLKDDVTAIQNWIENFDNSYIAEAIGNYIATLIFFGLSDAGYFMAYIPKDWYKFKFGTTGLDTTAPCEPEYGHLVIKY